jgi:hypothetical protein
MSRQKLVFPTSEVFHLWANQTQHEARNSQGNVFFEGTSIYSYGRHFKLAELLPGLGICIFNSNSYSNTTAKQQYKTRAAVDKYTYNTWFFIPDCDVHKANDYFLNVIDTNLKKLVTARKKEQYIETIRNTVKTAMLFFKYFPQVAPSAELVERFNNPPTLTPEQIAAHKQQQKQLRDRKKQQQIELQKANEEKIQEWTEGKRSSLPYSIEKVYLRKFVNIGNEIFVETSKGAFVPYREAKILFRELQQQPPTLGKYLDGKIGNYTIHHLRNNILTIGCHHIEMSEVMRFAASQGWTTNSIEITEPTLN